MGAKNKTGRKLLPSLTRRPLVERCNRRRPESSSHAAADIRLRVDGNTEFVACDNPHATRLTLHILAAVAEHEREAISRRTKAALQAPKARGIRLGRNGAERLAPANEAAAADRARQLADILAKLTGRWHVGAADRGRTHGAHFRNAL
jgi:Resolvase, N terminal domain